MWEILQYPFFQNALLGSLLASILCALVGTYIVSRRLVFISGGITHALYCRLWHLRWQVRWEWNGCRGKAM